MGHVGTRRTGCPAIPTSSFAAATPNLSAPRRPGTWTRGTDEPGGSSARSSPYLGRPHLPRRLTQHPNECPTHPIHAAESGRPRDPSQVVAGGLEQPARSLHPEVEDIPGRGRADVGGEDPSEVADAHGYAVGQRGGGEVAAAEVVSDPDLELLNQAHLARLRGERRADLGLRGRP